MAKIYKVWNKLGPMHPFWTVNINPSIYNIYDKYESAFNRVVYLRSVVGLGNNLICMFWIEEDQRNEDERGITL